MRIGKKDQIVPFFCGCTPTTNSDCPADFELSLDIFAMPLAGHGVIAFTRAYEDCPAVPHPRVIMHATEAEVVASAVASIHYVWGKADTYGKPSQSSDYKLATWNALTEAWPILCTKWLRYREQCGSLPYPALLQDPTQKWFSCQEILSVDAVYRVGRANKMGPCEVDSGLAMRYLLKEDIPSLEPRALRTWLHTNPMDALAALETWLTGVTNTLWLAYGV